MGRRLKLHEKAYPTDIKLKKHQTYLGNRKLKRDGVEISFTKQQIKERKKCREDIIYFTRRYMKITHVDKGLIPFEMWDFQEDLLNHLVDNRFSIIGTGRQVGKSILTVTFLLHYILFNGYKNVGMIANKGDTARKILGRLKLAYENLPYWLQQGVLEWNKGTIELENGSKIIACATSSSAARGDSFSAVFVDEAAFIGTNIWDEFYKSVYPTISSGTETKMILVSTPNGLNHFYKLFTYAEDEKNDYKPFSITWESVPGRDQKWKDQTIANTSEEDFLQEHCMEFQGSSNTLVSSTKIRNLTSRLPEWLDLNSGEIVYTAPIEGHHYILTADCGHGLLQDYSAFSVIDITEYPFEQVATYRNNRISPLLYPNKIEKYAKLYNMADVLVENNDRGHEVVNILHYDIEYENVIHISNRKEELGIRTTKAVKRVGCSNFKDLIENDKLIIKDQETIDEIAIFVEKGKSYEADGDGHDDMVMGLVLFSWLSTQDYFKDLTDKDTRKALFQKQMQDIEDDVVPWGVIDDGMSDDSKEPFWEDGVLWTSSEIFPFPK